jgi:transcriptional regulator with XRE-family HTH domain
MTPDEDESLREAPEALEQQDSPRDEAHVAELKAMGRLITFLRTGNVSREELAAKCEMTVQDLDEIERGKREETWGGYRKIVEELGIPFSAFVRAVEEHTPGPGGGSGASGPGKPNRAARWQRLRFSLEPGQ